MTGRLKDPATVRRELQGESVEDPSQMKDTTTISVDETIRGVNYRGTFVYKVPTLADSILIGRMKTQYLPEGSAADQTAALLVEQICYLEVTLQQPRPAWWKPLEFREGDLVALVYSEALAYANKFLGRHEKHGTAESSDDESGDGWDASSDEGDVGEDLSGADQRSKITLSHSTRAK